VSLLPVTPGETGEPALVGDLLVDERAAVGDDRILLFGVEQFDEASHGITRLPRSRADV